MTKSLTNVDPATGELIEPEFDQILRAQAALEYGAKVLGSFLGTDEYVKAQLDKKLLELEDEKQLLILVPSSQNCYLMLVWCFSQKVTHLQRTIRPSRLTDFVKRFDRMKKEVFVTLLQNRYTADDLPDKIWTQARLHVKDAGLGLHFTEDMTHCAYVASLIECLPTIAIQFPEVEEWFKSAHQPVSDDDAPRLPTVSELASSLQVLSQSLEQVVTFEWVRSLSLERLESDELSNHCKLQSILAQKMRKPRVDKFMESLSNADLAWFVSNSNSESGRWLQSAPRCPQYKMSSKQFTSALCYRLRLDSPFIPPGTKCSCKKKPDVDRHGLHLTALCGEGGYRHKLHDSVVLALERLFNSCKFRTKVEERGAFDLHDQGTGRRPDLTIFNLPGYREKLLTDLQVTSPVSNVSLTRNQALVPLRAAETAHKQKIRSYGDLPSRNELEFIPLIIESTGRMHGGLVRLIDDALRHKTDTDNRWFERQRRYWYTTISFLIQKLTADSLINRAADLQISPSGSRKGQTGGWSSSLSFQERLTFHNSLCYFHR